MTQPLPYSFPEFRLQPLDAYQLHAALLDLAEFGWVHLDCYEHARQVLEAVQRLEAAGRFPAGPYRLREGMGGSWWTVERVPEVAM